MLITPFSDPSVHSFNKYSLSTYSEPGVEQWEQNAPISAFCVAHMGSVMDRKKQGRKL